MPEYIDRALVHRMMVGLQRYKWTSPVLNEQRITVDADDVNFGIDKIPNADVVQVIHAKWIKIEDDICYWYGCSNCKEEVLKNRYGYDLFSCYCPNCGAKMDMEE